MQRSREGGNSPVQVSWFVDRIEIIRPGGPFGDVAAQPCGRPGLIACRNPNLAGAVRASALVQRYGVGLPLAPREPRASSRQEPAFEADAHRRHRTIRARPDWPGSPGRR